MVETWLSEHSASCISSCGSVAEPQMELQVRKLCYQCRVRRAALAYNVLKSMLHDRVSGRVLLGATGGAPCYLDDEEEEEERVVPSGFWHTTTRVMHVVSM